LPDLERLLQSAGVAAQQCHETVQQYLQLRRAPQRKMVRAFAGALLGHFAMGDGGGFLLRMIDTPLQLIAPQP